MYTSKKDSVGLRVATVYGDSTCHAIMPPEEEEEVT
jgi:hypothetical protein